MRLLRKTYSMIALAEQLTPLHQCSRHMPRALKKEKPGAFLRRCGDPDMITRMLADTPNSHQFSHTKRFRKHLIYSEMRFLRYPLIDHETTWRASRSGKGSEVGVLVSHAYWNEASIEQLQELQERLNGSGTTVVVRDAVWSGIHDIKQVFIMGSEVPQEDVLALPYDFFDDRCSQGIPSKAPN